MKLVYICLICFLMFPLVSEAKYQVCSITINSSDEIEMFRKNLNPQDFNFVELVPLSDPSPSNNSHWFNTACRRGHRCDILVISGHFGGLFFGEQHNYILPLDIMEKQACSDSCKGVLSHVKEVFLFGCNTLAGKLSDRRTPEEYLQVLLSHQMVRDLAETVVSARYLPLGLSFQEQMQMIFPAHTSIYGFPDVSPLGRNMRQPLNNYLQYIRQQYGSYKNYLENKEPINTSISKIIGHNIREVKGAGPKDKQFKKICSLYKESTSNKEGLKTVQNMMQNGEGLKAWLAIKNFISKRKPFTNQSLQIFNKIKNNLPLKQEFFSVYKQISPRLPYVRVQFLNFLNFFEYLQNDFYTNELRANIHKMIQSSDLESYNYVWGLVREEKTPVSILNLTTEDFQPSFYRNIWSPLIVEELKVQDYLVHRRLMNLCLSHIGKSWTDESFTLCYQVFKSLGHLRFNDSLVVDKMATFLETSEPGLIYYSIYALANSGAQSAVIHQKIAQHCEHPDKWIRLQATRALGLLKSQDLSTNQTLFNCLQNSEDEEMIFESLKALFYMQPPLEELRNMIYERKLYEHPNKDIQNLANSF